MLSDRNVREINHQIANEMRTVNGFCKTHEEKMEALERIAQLKALLSPQPSRQDILQELATAIREQQAPTPAQSFILDGLASVLRR